MRRAEARWWRGATGLDDLGERVVGWLHGVVVDTPGHAGMDEETVPLVPILTAVNRAGFVTDNSQLAEVHGGQAWNTWVVGFASGATLARIRAAAAGAGLTVTACRGREHGERHGLRDGFQCPARRAVSEWAYASPGAARDLRGSWYVRVSDPVPGRNDLLWGTLARFAGVPMPQHNMALMMVAHDAAEGARALAGAAEPRKAAKRLSVADHVDVLSAIAGAIGELGGQPGVLQSTQRVVAAKSGRHPGGPREEESGRALPALEGLVARAQQQAERADLGPAIERVRDDVQRLAGMRCSAAERAPRGNLVAARGREAAELIRLFARGIGPDAGPLDDVVSALSGAGEITLALRLACMCEGRLVAVAYEPTGLRRRGEIVTEIVTGAAAALERVHGTLGEATAAAKALKEAEIR